MLSSEMIKLGKEIKNDRQTDEKAHENVLLKYPVFMHYIEIKNNAPFLLRFAIEKIPNRKARIESYLVGEREAANSLF